MIPHFVRRSGAAAYIESRYGFPCSRHWLAKLAVKGGGPIYCKAGKFPLYAPADLDAWASSKIGPRQSSTAVILHEAERGR
jgi:hypothetical protein